LQSTAWQEQLYSTMGWKIPQWFHHPLVVGRDGKRLAKRHGDSRISTLRSRGVPAERIIGLIAMWTNTQESLQPISLNQFTQSFEIESLTQEDIIFSKKEEAWLFA
jgi:glutamyl-tRNA synthetase